MMNGDKVTLGIPLYNAPDFIEKSLLSALNQTYPNIEYLFVDDKGNSMDIVRRVVAEHPRRHAVRIIDQKTNQGIAVARNAILEHATGSYLFTMDCDDVITEDCIEILYNKMQEHPVDFVAASFIRCDTEGNEYPGCQYEDTLIEGEGHPVALYRYGHNGKLFVAAWNKLYRTDFLEKYHIRCQPGHLNEDPWFTYQVIMNARSCRLIPDCTLHYTYNPDSVSGKSASKGFSEKIARQFLEIEQLKRAYIKPLSSEAFYRALLTDIMEMSIYFSYRIAETPQLLPMTKQELQHRLLSLVFTPPASHGGGKRTLKYAALKIFYTLPLKCKMALINGACRLRIKDRINKRIHF